MPKTNISIIDLRNLTGVPSTDLGTLISRGSFNQWSRWKPIDSPEVTLTEAELKKRNFGLNITNGKITDWDNIKPWGYNKPKGGASSPYRLGDVRDYNTDARPFLMARDLPWNDAITKLEDLRVIPTFKFGTGSGDGQDGAGTGGLSSIEILPSELALTQYGISSFAEWYMGVRAEINGAECYCFSNCKFGEVTASKTLYVPLYDVNDPTFTNNFTLTSTIRNLAVGGQVLLTPFLCYTKSATADKYSFPEGNQIAVIRMSSVSYEVVPLTLVIVSPSVGVSQPIANNNYPAVRVRKPANATETLMMRIRCTFKNDTSSPVSVSNTACSVSIGGSSRYVIAGWSSSETATSYEANLQIPAKSSVTKWVFCQGFPGSLIRNLPEDDGTSTTQVSLSFLFHQGAAPVQRPGAFLVRAYT